MASLGVCELYSLRGTVHELNLIPLTGFLAASYGRWLAIRSTIHRLILSFMYRNATKLGLLGKAERN